MKCDMCPKGTKTARPDKAIWRSPWGDQKLRCYCITHLLQIAKQNLDNLDRPANRHGLHFMEYNRMVASPVNGAEIRWLLELQTKAYLDTKMVAS
jgi:hypothetical protein